MTENKRFEMIITGADGSFHYLDKNTGEKITSTLELENKLNALHEENKQLKQFPVKLDNRIQKLEESLKALKEVETDDLNPQAVEDVATIIAISLNALTYFKKELNER